MAPQYPEPAHYAGSPYSTGQPAPQRITPSGWWFVFGALLIVGGLVGGVVLGVLGFVGMAGKVDDLQRVPVPGTGTVQLTETGGYTVNFEYPGASAHGFPGRITTSITDPSGAAVQLQEYSANVTYTFGKHEGRAAFSFTVNTPGTYRVTTTGGPATAAIGRGFGTSLAGSLVGACALGFGGLVLGVIALIVVGVKRGRSKRRAAAPAGWTGGYPPGPQQSGPQQYGPSQSGPQQYGPSQSGPQQYGPPQYGPPQSGPREY
ncbi:hypothetical protein [Nocardia sp. NPDC049149]|uniref:hypothetical protein n=1 Tax=Nocardia sp. NPDC049149 TaxID=3364315 RepID=UPI0037167167